MSVNSTDYIKNSFRYLGNLFDDFLSQIVTNTTINNVVTNAVNNAVTSIVNNVVIYSINNAFVQHNNETKKIFNSLNLLINNTLLPLQAEGPFNSNWQYLQVTNENYVINLFNYLGRSTTGNKI